MKESKSDHGGGIGDEYAYSVPMSAQVIKGSDKLLRLEVDIGEKRQVVAGIAKS